MKTILGRIWRRYPLQGQGHVPENQPCSGGFLPPELALNAGISTSNYEYGHRDQQATRWLTEHLTSKQRNQLTEHQSFIVKGSLGGKYLLTADKEVYDTRGRKYCVYAYGYNGKYAFYPYADSLLAILLTLRTDERLFRKTAVKLSRKDGQLRPSKYALAHTLCSRRTHRKLSNRDWQ